jgi:hypothetical protein
MLVRFRSQTHFSILRPARLITPELFRNIDLCDWRHQDLLSKMQRLRGSAYRADGAIHPSELTTDGRHELSIDHRCWHVLSLDANGDVVACMRYLEERRISAFDSLRVRYAALAHPSLQGNNFRRAVEGEIEHARRASIGFGEVGGWAVREDYRGTPEALRIVLATYALLELLGSCTGIATATFRHGSASILRRIGLTALCADGQEITPYHDLQYGCLMQVLRFDSRSPNPKYRARVDALMGELVTTPVISRENLSGVFGQGWSGTEAWHGGWHGGARPHGNTDLREGVTND